MLIFHCADTHLGYRTFNKTVPPEEEYAGSNQREIDLYNAWEALVQEAIEIKPDVFIHAGDFFDRVSPSNRAIERAREGLYRLSDAGIRSVILAGNHETPRLSETGHVFSLLERIPSVWVLYDGNPETVEIGDLMITGVAHSSGLADQVNRALPDPNYRYNILVTHGSVKGAGIGVFENHELNQTTLPLEIFQKQWDYIALGHYHNFTKLQGNMYYCGSPERLSIAESESTKGYALVKLPELDVEHRKMEAREFVKLEYDAKTHAHDSLTDKLMEIIRFAEPEGKIVRLRIKNLTRELWATVDRKSLQNVAKGALNLAMEPDLVSSDSLAISTSEIGPLTEEFQRYLEEVPIEDITDKEKQFILDKAQEVLF